MRIRKFFIFCIMAHVYSSAHSTTATLPKNIIEQLPKGYSVIVAKSGDVNNDKLMDYIVVLHKENEKEIYQRTEEALKRPVLIFTQKPGNTFALSARNDSVVYKIDEGGQCDPFVDNGTEGVTIKGVFFTIENGVACGAHWSDFITFKYSETLRNWVFHKRIYENWELNNSQNSNADALVLDSRKVMSSKKNSPLLFQDYKVD